MSPQLGHMRSLRIGAHTIVHNALDWWVFTLTILKRAITSFALSLYYTTTVVVIHLFHEDPFTDLPAAS
jgi:hypothetical protein